MSIEYTNKEAGPRHIEIIAAELGRRIIRTSQHTARLVARNQQEADE